MMASIKPGAKVAPDLSRAGDLGFGGEIGDWQQFSWNEAGTPI
jgi:hypothetical protein